jgi:hypothetical protein
MIDEFTKGKAIIRVKRRKYSVPLRHIRISRSNSKVESTKEKKIAQLRQRISSEIDRKILLKIIKKDEQSKNKLMDGAINHISKYLKELVR